MDRELLKAGLEPGTATKAVVGGKIVNVYSGEIYPGGVAIYRDKILAVGEIDEKIGPQTEVIEAGGNYIVPGFIEGHIHPESSNLSVPRFAEAVVKRGTTTVFTDFHEVAIVGGLAAVDAVLDEARKTVVRFFWMVPSHVPFSPGLETSGGRFDASIIVPALDRPEAVGLAEVVNTYVVGEHPDLMESVAGTWARRKSLCGHGPMMKGRLWDAFTSIGIQNDHEAIDLEDAIIRIRNGVHAHLRHNLIVPTLPELVRVLTELRLDSRLVSLVTDDTNAIVLTREGHIDYLAREAMRNGVDFVTAIQMVTLNVAQSYHKELEIGGLAPGRYADLNIITYGPNFEILKTMAGGEVVVERGNYVGPPAPEGHAPLFFNTFHVAKPELVGTDLVIHAPPDATGARVHYMKTLAWVPVTEGVETDLPVRDGYVAAAPERDILHIAVVERHHRTGNIGKAFVGGFGIRSGAYASSMAHDNHNIVVMGSDPEDMALAVQRVIELDGGLVVAEGGRVLGEIQLNQFGLLSDLSGEEMAARKAGLLELARERGCIVSELFMFMGFITLVPIPAFKITDRGYVDCLKSELKDPVLEWL
ncbi:MAG: adenine deaminase C-terminal domain-containing protein [Verrucomicrobiia bacterium]